jgi:hypothetical protein
MTERTILINRAPVLTLWATTAAERLGFDQDEALSLGKAVAGLTAQSKGQQLGIYKPGPQGIKKVRARKRGEEFLIEICGRQVPAINTTDGVRAVIKNYPIESNSVERYLESEYVVYESEALASSPNNLQRNLDLSRSCCRGRDHACTGNGNSVAIEDRLVGCWRIEIGMIKGVEDFHAELDVERFGYSPYGIIFEERSIEFDQTGADEAVATGVANEVRTRGGRGWRGRVGEGHAFSGERRGLNGESEAV